METESEKDSSQSAVKKDRIDDIYLEDNNEDKTSTGSPLKPCPKSPLKRMKNLEQQENAKDAENIETTYKKSPERTLTIQVNETQPEDQVDDQVTQENKTLLQAKDSLQEPEYTEQQAEKARF